MIARYLLASWIAFAAVALAPAAEARSPYAGRYRVMQGPGTAGMLDLRADGTFRYRLSDGALDEYAEGRWNENGGDIRLDTDPKPVAPAFARGPDGGTETIHVVLSDGRDLPGVDFRLGLVGGTTLAGYTQAEGWSFVQPGDRRIAWVELHEPIHGVTSQRFVIDPPAAGGLTFVLTPNDIAVVDFADARLERRSDDFLLDRRGRKLRLVREP